MHSFLQLSKLQTKCVAFTLVCFLLFLLSACERNNQAQFYGLGTLINVSVKTHPKNARDFVKQLELQSQQQEIQLYAWGAGELARLNTNIAQAKCFPDPSPDLVTLLVQAKNLNQLSDSLFEPAIAPLVKLWNFHDITQMQETVPSTNVINKTLQQISSISNLKINTDQICARSKVQLDLGAIGKGWGAQKAASLLRQHRIQNALIDFGGDLILKGKNPNNKAWQIGLRDPSTQAPPASFSLSTESEILAVFTSGDYERGFSLNNKRYHHLLDPRSGYPANSLRSVTVVHQDPMLADAAATALFIAGDNWQALAKKMQLQEVLVIYPEQIAEISTKLQNKTRWLNKAYKVSTVEL